MPPTTAPERTGASGQYYVPPPPAPKRLLSPASYLGLAVVAIITAIIILRLVSSFQGGGTAVSFQDSYQQVDLGQFTCELAPESGAILREPFMLKVAVVLNPNVRDLASLKSQVERRRDLFRHIILNEILDKKTDAELRKPAIVDTLLVEIKDRLNRELGSSRDAQESISKVLFSDKKLPQRR